MIALSERGQIIFRLTILFLIAGVLAVAMYFLFFKTKPAIDQPISNGGTPTLGTGGLPTSGEGDGGLGTTPTPGTGGTGQLPSSPVADGGRTTVVTLTTAAVTEPSLMANGSLAYYDGADGRFYSIDRTGRVESLSDAHFPQAEQVTFSPTATEAVIEFPDGSNVVYDFETNRQVTLPAHWEDFSFDGAGTQIASKSISADPSARALVVSAADGSSTSVVAALGTNNDLVDVNWSPDGAILGFSRTGGSGSAFGQNEIYTIGPDGEAAGILIVNGTDFSALWSPSANNLIYSVADAGDDYRASLWYADKDGDRKGTARKAIPLKTLAEKCTFASDAVAYCAVPTSMPEGGGTNPALITANDNVYRIDLPSARVTLLAIPSAGTKMFNLKVSAGGDLLYYTDNIGRLNYLRLK